MSACRALAPEAEKRSGVLMEYDTDSSTRGRRHAQNFESRPRSLSRPEVLIVTVLSDVALPSAFHL